MRGLRPIRMAPYGWRRVTSCGILNGLHAPPNKALLIVEHHIPACPCLSSNEAIDFRLPQSP